MDIYLKFYCGVSGQYHTLPPLPLGSAYWSGGWGLGTGLDRYGEEKIYFCQQDSNPGPSTV
jgi:hypothetical protein